MIHILELLIRPLPANRSLRASNNHPIPNRQRERQKQKAEPRSSVPFPKNERPQEKSQPFETRAAIEKRDDRLESRHVPAIHPAKNRRVQLLQHRLRRVETPAVREKKTPAFHRPTLYPYDVEANELKTGLAQARKTKDPVVKHLLLAALCTRIFAERKVELIVVGGSAIEFYTEGAYTSGDVDLCIADAERSVTVRDRQELMGFLGAKGGPRSWEVAGAFVDILGAFETLSKTKPRQIETSLGPVKIAPPEELIVERVFVAGYPSKNPPALKCANKLIAAALRKEIEIDWKETLRIAKLSAYDNESDLKKAIAAKAKALALRSPYDSDE